MRPAPGPAECLIHNWLTLTFSQQLQCPSLQTVQSSDYSYQSPSNDVFTMADYQHRVSNCDFNENWHETKSGKQCESVISTMLQSTITAPAYLGIFQIHMIKTSRPRIEEGCILVPCWPLISRVSCFLYICVIQTSHTSCQHPRCHAIVCPIRGLDVMSLANKRSANIELGDNKAFLQILFPSLWQPGLGRQQGDTV